MEELEEFESEDFESKDAHGELLTIDEMKELLQQEPYKPYDDSYSTELSYDEQTGLYYTDYFKDEDAENILLNHLLAEQCVMHTKELDWCRVTDGYDATILATIVGLYCNPLAWCEIPPSLTNHYVIVGKMAKEVSDYNRSERMDLMTFLLNESREERALWFADHLPARGIAKWENFLSNYCRADLLKVMSPECNYLPLPHLNPQSLKENLEYVVWHRGMAKAQEVLDRLRKEWNHLVKLKLCNFGELSEEEIESLHEFVFDTLNYQMDLWAVEYGAEDEEVAKQENEKPEAFTLLTDTCRAEHKEKKVISELRAACKGTAVGLWKVIRENEALDYLGTKGMQAAKIYRAFAEFFGQLPYSERNFRDAREKR